MAGKTVALQIVGGSIANGLVRFAVVRDKETDKYGLVAVEEPDWVGAQQLAVVVGKGELLHWLRTATEALEREP